MLQALQIIYNRLYDNLPTTELDSKQVIRFLNEKLKIDSNQYYSDLSKQILTLKCKTIRPLFIERYCLSKLSEYILTEYPVNIAEAFALAYILLNKPVDINTLYFKLGTSGLLTPTIIRGEKIEDIEAIAQFVITSLLDADLIKKNSESKLIPGSYLNISL